MLCPLSRVFQRRQLQSIVSNSYGRLLSDSRASPIGSNSHIRVCMFPVARRADDIKYAYVVVSAQHNRQIKAKEVSEQTAKGLPKFLKPTMKKIKVRLAKEWNQVRQAESHTMKGKLFRLFLKAKSYIDPHELFLVELSEGFKSKDISATLEILHPVVITETTARLELDAVMKRVLSVNALYMGLYGITMVPASLLGMLIPGPNVVLIGYVMRLYSLYLSRITAQSLSPRLMEKKGGDAGGGIHPIEHHAVHVVPDSVVFDFRAVISEASGTEHPLSSVNWIGETKVSKDYESSRWEYVRDETLNKFLDQVSEMYKADLLLSNTSNEHIIQQSGGDDDALIISKHVAVFREHCTRELSAFLKYHTDKSGKQK